jgi:hypothetical protein
LKRCTSARARRFRHKRRPAGQQNGTVQASISLGRVSVPKPTLFETPTAWIKPGLVKIEAAVVSILIAGSVSGAWNRVLISNKDLTDVPPPHSLPYFEASACAAIGPGDRTKHCAARTELRQIGSVGEFKLYDLDYYLPSDDRSEYFAAESVLLQPSPGLFHELLYRGLFQDLPKVSGFAVLPAQTAVAGNETILEVRVELGGMYHNFETDYFLFTPTGFKRIDPKPVFDAAEPQLAENTSTYFIISSFNFPKETWDVCVQRNDLKESRKMMGCLGTIRVQFKIRNGVFVVTGATLNPN